MISLYKIKRSQEVFIIYHIWGDVDLNKINLPTRTEEKNSLWKENMKRTWIPTLCHMNCPQRPHLQSRGEWGSKFPWWAFCLLYWDWMAWKASTTGGFLLSLSLYFLYSTCFSSFVLCYLFLMSVSFYSSLFWIFRIKTYILHSCLRILIDYSAYKIFFLTWYNNNKNYCTHMNQVAIPTDR